MECAHNGPRPPSTPGLCIVAEQDLRQEAGQPETYVGGGEFSELLLRNPDMSPPYLEVVGCSETAHGPTSIVRCRWVGRGRRKEGDALARLTTFGLPQGRALALALPGRARHRAIEDETSANSTGERQEAQAEWGPQERPAIVGHNHGDVREPVASVELDRARNTQNDLIGDLYDIDRRA